ncbi:DNA polymerase sliding clamp [Halobacterium bonnevillei]|uniref:DNA polymerase sliding clamp n=1 Tax=Halobacterium bonnevillei TaxID=2692200 RepID=A0A6B0SFL6_9EURY|nr:DNA polymerase sliding clamp [Halobacterium bonnevillei]MXR20525.1 DNA polymerase sliding clamp [Halobacterium bonnevillei]
MTQDTATRPATNHVEAPADAAFTAIASAPILETILDDVAVLVDECVLRVDTDGVSVDAMDPATVAMVSLSVDAEAFEAYDAPDEVLRLGIDIERLGDVVGMADADQAVRLAVDLERRTLHVRVGELAYTLALIDPDAVRSPPDRVDLADQFEATVGLPGREFSRAVAAADMVSDHLEAGVSESEERFYVRADGDADTVAVDVPAEDCTAFDSGPARSLFSLQYLSAVERAVPADDPVRLRLGEEAPVEVEFDVADGDGSVRYVVSPRLTRS